MATIALRVDDSLKKEASDLFKDLGIDMSTAVKMFLIQSVETRGLPFEVRKRDKELMFQQLVESKSTRKVLNFNNSSDVEEFFGDEDFSEYDDLFED